MRRLIALAVATGLVAVLASSPASARTEGRIAADARCDTLNELVAMANLFVVEGIKRGPAAARKLRELAKREVVPKRVKPAMRKIARLFDEASDQSVLERTQEAAKVAGAIAVLVDYFFNTCDVPSSRPLTSTPPN